MKNKYLYGYCIQRTSDNKFLCHYRDLCFGYEPVIFDEDELDLVKLKKQDIEEVFDKKFEVKILALYTEVIG